MKDKKKINEEEQLNLNEEDLTVYDEEKIEFTKEEVEAMNSKTLQLEKKLEEVSNEVLKAKAELVNYRKRKDEEVNKLLKYSNLDMALELVSIMDNFERAINSETKDENLIKGLKMIYSSLVNLLNKFDIHEIDALNKPFDANLHQAVSTEEHEKKDIVIEVFQKGYMIKDKLLRPSMVKVSK